MARSCRGLPEYFGSVDKPRIVIVDDHAVLRESLASVLDGRFRVVGAWADAESALPYLAEQPVEVAILDYALPGVDGICAARQIKALRPETKCMLLSMHCQKRQVLEAFDAGMMAYLPKEVSMTELIDAIDRVLRGEFVLSPLITRQLVTYLTADGGAVADLTGQHVDILRLAGCGFANQQIADRLGLNVNTVKLRLKEANTRLGTRDRTHAVVVALQRGLFGLEDAVG